MLGLLLSVLCDSGSLRIMILICSERLFLSYLYGSLLYFFRYSTLEDYGRVLEDREL